MLRNKQKKTDNIFQRSSCIWFAHKGKGGVILKVPEHYPCDGRTLVVVYFGAVIVFFFAHDGIRYHHAIFMQTVPVITFIVFGISVLCGLDAIVFKKIFMGWELRGDGERSS